MLGELLISHLSWRTDDTACCHIIAIFPPVKKFLIPRLAKRSANWPRPLQTSAVRIADNAWPDWRTYRGGSRRARHNTYQRLLEVRRGRRLPRILLLSSTYVDVWLTPVRLSQLRRENCSGLDRVQCNSEALGPFLRGSTYASGTPSGRGFSHASGGRTTRSADSCAGCCETMVGAVGSPHAISTLLKMNNAASPSIFNRRMTGSTPRSLTSVLFGH